MVRRRLDLLPCLCTCSYCRMCCDCLSLDMGASPTLSFDGKWTLISTTTTCYHPETDTIASKRFLQALSKTTESLQCWDGGKGLVICNSTNYCNWCNVIFVRGRSYLVRRCHL